MTSPQQSPGYQSYGWQPPLLRAPEGTNPGTPWIWLIVAIPVVQILLLIPFFSGYNELFARIFSLAASQPSGGELSPTATREILSWFSGFVGPLLLVSIGGWVLNALGVLFGWLDWRELRRRGVPNPFHWAYGFFAFAGGGTLVYLIGRAVVVRRRTGTGGAPLWDGIAV